ESGRARDGQPNGDTLRRLAGEQERVAERLRRVQEGLEQAASAPAGQEPAGDAARDIQNQRLAERMQQSADAMRSASGQSGASSGQQSSSPTPDSPTPSGTPSARPGAANQAGAQQE